MINRNIRTSYPHQHVLINNYTDDIFVADYSEVTRAQTVKRTVEIFSITPPTDIKYFAILNPQNIHINGIPFNNTSFVLCNGSPRSQCEAVFFPAESHINSWILFCELKYSNIPKNNYKNLKKAIRQLYRTQHYYIQSRVISNTNNCYLIASLPLQPEPFSNFTLSQSFLTKLKSRRNIILRLKNSIHIIDSILLDV
ncbi:MAG: hypothetical protein V2A54_04865 [Bacteroidota bacterium]